VEVRVAEARGLDPDEDATRLRLGLVDLAELRLGLPADELDRLHGRDFRALRTEVISRAIHLLISRLRLA
jgi:hypothetical protein